jgi:hypothetical protein
LGPAAIWYRLGQGGAKAAPDEGAPGESGALGASGERKAALFSLKAAATTVGGGLLTWGFTVAQIAYTDHLTVLQRQADQGITFQRDVFALTGQIENQAIDVFNAAKNGDPAQAAALRQSTLHVSNEQWRLVRLWFRIRGAQIYGRRVGDLVYDPDEESVGLDACAVEYSTEQPAGRGACPPRQAAEARRLAGIIARVRANRVVGGDAELHPASFQANWRLLRAALDVYIACLQTAAARNVPGRPCDRLEQIVASRLQFTVFARENLSTEIMGNSALRD